MFHTTVIQGPEQQRKIRGVLLIHGLQILGGLFYRLVFHPLAKYPGPLIGCLTDWYSAYWLVHGGRHLNFHNQHKKYGT